jgi:hypothetical protein
MNFTPDLGESQEKKTHSAIDAPERPPKPHAQSDYK